MTVGRRTKTERTIKTSSALKRTHQLVFIKKLPFIDDVSITLFGFHKKVKPKLPVAFIFGNEVGGVPSEVLSRADVVAEIAMQGSKESLNVSVAAGVALARMLGR